MTTPAEKMDAYALLSTPTLDLSDADVEAIIIDLRKRRELYITTGKVDKVAKPKAAATPRAKATSDEKARNTAALLAQLTIKPSE